MAQWSSFVAIGDSFTEGLDDPDGRGGYRGWADLVASRLATLSPGFRYANLAIRGRLLDQVIAEQVPPALEMSPDLVSFAAGGNDALRPKFDPDRTRDALLRVVSELASTGATVVMFTAADATVVLPGLLGPRLTVLNAVVREVAQKCGATLVDLWHDPGFRHPAMWSEDRLHLSGYGHRRVASRVLEALGQPYPPQWRDDPPSGPPTSWLAARRADLRWMRRHLAPWVYRRLTGRSSGDTVQAKRPRLEPVSDAPPAGS